MKIAENGSQELNLPQCRYFSMTAKYKIVLSTLAALFIIYLPAAHAAEIYKTVDENGKVTYSDKITNNQSKKLDIKGLNTLPSVTPRGPQSEKPRSLIPTEYKITIVKPTNETHLNPGDRDLSIQVTTVPNVYKTHKLQLSDNGSPVQGNLIQNISRGTHVLIAVVVDERGRVISRSQPTTIYVHRPVVPRPIKSPKK